MSDVGKRIRQRREELGYTQADLAKKLGYKSKTTINKIEMGINDITQHKIVKFAEALDCSPSYLMGWSEDKSGLVPLSKKGKKKIPILGHVAAGVPIEMFDNVIGYTLYDDDPDGDYFGLVVKGDSMEPYMYSGDIVIVRQQPDVESGQIAVVAVNGSDATCKRIMKDKDGVSLVSINPKYMPQRFDNEQIVSKPITIIGKVIELKRKVD